MRLSPLQLPEATKVKTPKKDEALVLGMDKQSLDYTMAACCRPIPGDDVFGFVTVSGGIKIHRSACPNSTQLLSKYGYRVLKARWAGEKEKERERPRRRPPSPFQEWTTSASSTTLRALFPRT